jgi:hypothetical protein
MAEDDLVHLPPFVSLSREGEESDEQAEVCDVKESLPSSSSDFLVNTMHLFLLVDLSNCRATRRLMGANIVSGGLIVKRNARNLFFEEWLSCY